MASRVRRAASSCQGRAGAGSTVSKSAGSGGSTADGQGNGSFHFLNAQKRLLREYAKVHLGLGTRWRSSLSGIVSAKGTPLDETPSSQWTQDELDALYGAWGLVKPSPEALRRYGPVAELLFDERAGVRVPPTALTTTVARPEQKARKQLPGGGGRVAAQGAKCGGSKSSSSSEGGKGSDSSSHRKRRAAAVSVKPEPVEEEEDEEEDATFYTASCASSSSSPPTTQPRPRPLTPADMLSLLPPPQIFGPPPPAPPAGTAFFPPPCPFDPYHHDGRASSFSSVSAATDGDDTDAAALSSDEDGNNGPFALDIFRHAPNGGGGVSPFGMGGCFAPPPGAGTDGSRHLRPCQQPQWWPHQPHQQPLPPPQRPPAPLPQRHDAAERARLRKAWGDRVVFAEDLVGDGWGPELLPFLGVGVDDAAALPPFGFEEGEGMDVEGPDAPAAAVYSTLGC